MIPCIFLAARNLFTAVCVSSLSSLRFTIRRCEGGRHQHFEMNWHKDLRPRGRPGQCFDISIYSQKSPINSYACHGGKGNQLWQYELVRAKAQTSVMSMSTSRLLKFIVHFEGQEVARSRRESSMPGYECGAPGALCHKLPRGLEEPKMDHGNSQREEAAGMGQKPIMKHCKAYSIVSHVIAYEAWDQRFL